MKRITFIAAAALAALAIAPGSALATGAHFLGMYKVEKHLDIEGEGGTYTISCNDPSDIAVDGMWRLDNVEQDDDYYYAPLHPTGPGSWYDVDLAVEPVAAYTTAKDTYTFKFLPQSGGDAQGKLFLTCLPGSVVVNNGHTHTWSVDSRTDDPAFGTPSGVPTTNSGVATSCPTSTTDPEMAIAPGFQYTSTDDFGKPYERWPDSVKQPRKWTWGFISYASGTPPTVQTSYRCLHMISSAAGSPLHRHRIGLSSKYSLQAGTASGLIDHNRVTEIQTICGEHYKGMIGAWDLGSGNAATLWYLGMDPRPKARAYKILNSDPTTDFTPATSSGSAPRFALTCWKDRTT